MRIIKILRSVVFAFTWVQLLSICIADITFTRLKPMFRQILENLFNEKFFLLRVILTQDIAYL